ncbi:MAG: YmdB family metallophosphoesterase [Patescibacteria group bacterium]
MNILFIGDIVGKIGRKAVAAVLPELRKEHNIDLVIGNVENLAHGKGITHSTLAEIMAAGVDFCTSGNHIWDKSEGLEILAQPDSPVIRPGNYPPGWPGVGEKVLTIGTKSILVINLLGRMFMKVSTDCPFRTLDSILTRHRENNLPPSLWISMRRPLQKNRHWVCIAMEE